MTETILNFVDNSTLSTVKRCALHAHYRYEMHWTPEDRPIYFDFGSAWHSSENALWIAVCHQHVDQANALSIAYDAFLVKWAELGRDPNPSQTILEEWTPRTPGIAKEMLKNYIAQRYDWLRYKVELLAVEQPFVVPLDPNDHTIFYTGRLDKVIREGGFVKVPEHKTTTDYRVAGDHFSQQFIDSFDPNSQVEGYNHAAKVIYGEEAQGVFIDAALVHKKEHASFRMIPAYASKDRLEQWRQETLFWAQQWLQFKRVGFFPRNTNGCVDQYHKRCAYSNTCRQYGQAIYDLDPPRGMKVEKWEPYDLNVLRKAAEEVLKHG